VLDSLPEVEEYSWRGGFLLGAATVSRLAAMPYGARMRPDSRFLPSIKTGGFPLKHSHLDIELDCLDVPRIPNTRLHLEFALVYLARRRTVEMTYDARIGLDFRFLSSIRSVGSPLMYAHLEIEHGDVRGIHRGVREIHRNQATVEDWGRSRRSECELRRVEMRSAAGDDERARETVAAAGYDQATRGS
jgi:hypothetical protein